MQTRNTLLDDLARVASGALGVASGMRREAEELLRQRFSAVLASADLVTREEFEAVKEMAAKARRENEALERRIAALESARKPAARAPRTRKKPAAGREGTARPKG